MARSTRHDWFSWKSSLSHQPGQQRPTRRQPFHRRLRIEPLEDRRLLALVTVNTLNDTVDFNDGVTSLREAIFATNLVGGADEIQFAPSLTSGGPATITLKQGELATTDSLTITGPGANLLTIDASGNDPTPDTNNGDGSRVFNINDGISGNTLDVSISGLTLTGGDAGDSIGGGAVLSHENLAITNSTISGNSASGGFAGGFGGGILASGKVNVTITSSTISGNSAGDGGGISSGNVTVTSSTISDNSARFGGGIWAAYNVTVTSSTISGNFGTDSGGGVLGLNVTVDSSTISTNSAGSGGGIFGYHVTVTQSTISGNVAGKNGGGILANDGHSAGSLLITNSTIQGNRAGLDGGGIFKTQTAAKLSHTIIAGNKRRAGEANDVTGGATAAFSLIGVDTGATIIDNGGNIIGTAAAPIDPRLGPLADNGGPTMTHALLPGSPAIDAGDPDFDPADPDGDPMTDDAVPYDQRGAPFGRVFDGNSNGVARIDIGAYESQPDGTLGDYNHNGTVDAADYIVWRKTLGTSVAPPFVGADGDGNGTIKQGDLNVWRSNFGQPLGSGTGASAAVGRLSLTPANETTPQPSLSLESQASAASTATTVQPLPTSRAAFRSMPAMLGLVTQTESQRMAASTFAADAPVAAPQDDALLAWLTSRHVNQENAEGKWSTRPDVAAAGAADHDAISESLDAAFASLALGG